MFSRSTSFLAIFMAFVVLGQLGSAAAQQQGPTRKITQIVGDLYRFQNNFHFSVFLVTPEGVIATDPINRPAAEWLKREINERFGVPVKYVLYSHHHPDHVSGGDVFADTATFVGQENMLDDLASERAAPDAALPGSVEQMDANGNGLIERSEAQGRLAGGFGFIDANGDGAIIGFEMAVIRGGDVRPPDQTFSDKMTISLGGKSVELYYFGKSHTDNLIAMLFPEERTVFTVDYITVNRLPFRGLGDGYLPDLIDAIKRTEELDFDIVAPGHGELGGPTDVAANRAYVEELVAAVNQGIADGKTVEQLQDEIKLEKYADWGQYNDWRALNIAGAFRILSAAR